MKKLVFVNRKGGVGKTSLALLTGLWIQQKLPRNNKVFWEDGDLPQGSLSKSLENFGIDIINQPEDPETADYWIHDTSPKTHDLEDVLVSADKIIIPMTPTPMVEQATKEFVEQLAQVKQLGKVVDVRSKAVLVLNMITSTKMTKFYQSDSFDLGISKA